MRSVYFAAARATAAILAGCAAAPSAFALITIKPALSGTNTTTTVPNLCDDTRVICAPTSIGVAPGGGGGGGNQFPNDAFVASIAGSLSVVALDSSGNPTQGPLGGVLSRNTLNPRGAHDQGVQGGFQSWPTGSEPGGLTGLNWPFRDPLNSPNIPNPPVPGGFDNHPNNGSLFNRDAGILNIFAQQNWQQFGPRSPTGELGLSSTLNFYDTLLEFSDRSPRTIRITFTITSLEIRIASTGALFTDYTLDPVASTDLFVPAPSALALLALAPVAMRRRRVLTHTSFNDSHAR